MKKLLFVVFMSFAVATIGQQRSEFATNEDKEGLNASIVFEKGEAHNHPLMAVWVHDSAGNYIETLYVAKSIGTSVFSYGNSKGGKWEEGVHRRPAALPYWSHSRGVKAKDGLFIPHPENPMHDAVTGPTPKDDFVLKTTISEKVKTPFFILFEINQPWDWNEYWSNNKFPNDKEYKTSSQPAVVYMAEIKTKSPHTTEMKIAGRSHHAGSDGKLYPDTETLTTAKKIANEIKVIIR